MHGIIRLCGLLCLRLLYHKSSRHKPTRRYAVLLPTAKGFDDKMFSDRRVTAYRAFARRIIRLCGFYLSEVIISQIRFGASRHGGTPCFCLRQKDFGDKMFSDRRVTAYRAFARDNPLMRFICLRLLYHKSSRRKPTRRYAILLPTAKGFDDKMFSDRRLSAYRCLYTG